MTYPKTSRASPLLLAKVWFLVKPADADRLCLRPLGTSAPTQLTLSTKALVSSGAAAAVLETGYGVQNTCPLDKLWNMS